MEGQETSSWFVGPDFGRVTNPTLFPMGAVGAIEAAVRDAYGFGPDEAADVMRDVREAMRYRESSRLDKDDVDTPLTDDSVQADNISATHRLLSYAMGLVWGRWDCCAEHVRARADSANVFDFQVAPPALLSGPVEGPCEYPIQTLSAGIAHDDAGGINDIVRALPKALENVPDSIDAAPAVLLEDIRNYVAGEFFAAHLRQYTCCRRKAPIYWQLATPSASYSVWLYIHAFSKDTLFRVQNDYVAPKLAHEERRLGSLTTELRDGATATERKALAEQQALVEELRAFLAEVKRVAPLWNPDLDDGVIINFAPLWRLVPQHKAWQKELKSTWDALCEGKYGWAHLAMHLWPERVVPKCAKDRSLAIAHGLEGVFWEQDDNSRWQPTKVPESEIDQLIAERTSAAVKDALKSLLEAPAPVKGRGGGRRSPARRTVGPRDAAPRVRSARPGSA